MKDPAIVCGRESAARLTNDLSGPLEWHSFRFDLRAQRHAVDVLHDEIRLAIRQLAGVENTHDARMIDAGKRFFLLLKLLHDPRILQRLLVQDLYDDGLLVKLLIAR